MKKILYALNGVFHKGGTEAVVLNYYNFLDKSEYHIDFLLHGHEEDCRNNEVHQYLQSCGSKLFYVTPRGENFVRNWLEIKKIFRENTYDIVHSHMDAVGYFVLKEAKKADVPLCISHSHNTANTTSKKRSKYTIKWIMYALIHNMAIKKLPKVTDIRIACSREAGNWLFNGTDYIVLNNAIEIEKYSYNPLVREKVRNAIAANNSMVIGHVGRFSLQKNHDFLIDIFAELLKRNSNAKLVLVGTGELIEHIKHKVFLLGIEENVLFLGVRNDVDELMQAFDIFLLPSFFEGLPVAGVEAQASGLPCVISASVSPEVRLSDNVKLIPLNSPASEWCDAIEDLFSRHIDRHKGAELLRKAGFDVNSVISKLTKIYDNR